jgi:dienelactone hydrolase
MLRMPPCRTALGLVISLAPFFCQADPLPGTEPLTTAGDMSVQMVEGIDRWLEHETARVDRAREELWRSQASTREAWAAVAPARSAELAAMIGAVDPRRPGAIRVVSDAGSVVPQVVSAGYSVDAAMWPVFDGVNGEGLLLRPSGPAKAAIIVLPDADQTPEKSAGVMPGVPAELQFARRFAERGFLVLAPVLVDRRETWSGSEALKRYTNAPHREWIHRQSFEVGRTLTGFEVQKVLAAVDALKGPSSALLTPGAKIGVAGYGEGGLVALHAAAVDPRIDAAFVHGYFGGETAGVPIYRNLFGSRRQFTDAGLAAMIAPRPLLICVGGGPEVSGPPEPANGRRGAAPGQLLPVTDRTQALVLHEANSHRKRLGAAPVEVCALTGDGGAAQPTPELAMSRALGVEMPAPLTSRAVRVAATADAVDDRQRRTVRELEDFAQSILRASERTRKAMPLWTKLKPGAEWDAVQKQARSDFWDKVIGKLPVTYLPPNPRTRQSHDREKWRGYEVTLDVHPDIFAWGTLLVPKDLKPGERRPVVVCQHGLEGLPEDTITEDESSRAWRPYKAFAARLAARGFVVYAPHNPYRGEEKFRWLQRKANPLGLTLYSFINAQHDVTTAWLASLPFVDPERIGFYGLSYGGKTAMRVPAVIDRYCLSICSGDFNEWVLKCASNTHPAGYVFTHEWEIWEWDLGHTFNYAEMALLIAPRPFMVERGHDDGVGLDEHVGYEWGKVRRGYDKLGIGERAEIEWFDGPHTINGVGTFTFLHKWLRWPER